MPKSINLQKESLIFLSVFIFMMILVYLLLNGGAFWKETRYRLFLKSPLSAADLKNANLIDLENFALPDVPAGKYQLLIPKLSVNVPLVFPKNPTNADVLAALEDGVALFPGSTLPGEKGKSVVLGHSSRASWYRGDYATIFAIIDKLESGDEIYVVTSGKKYVYKVFANLILERRDANVLFNQKTDVSELDLVTCWPIGSAAKRKIIRAQLITEISI